MLCCAVLLVGCPMDQRYTSSLLSTNTSTKVRKGIIYLRIACVVSKGTTQRESYKTLFCFFSVCLQRVS